MPEGKEAFQGCQHSVPRRWNQPGREGVGESLDIGQRRGMQRLRQMAKEATRVRSIRPLCRLRTTMKPKLDELGVRLRLTRDDLAFVHDRDRPGLRFSRMLEN